MTDRADEHETLQPFIQYISILSERVPSFEEYPFSIPAIRNMGTLEFHSQVTFFAGENGSGKSTLLEALAVLEGLNPEGGSRGFDFSTRASHSNLARCMRIGRSPRAIRKTDAFFLRAESFYNVATEVERLGLGEEQGYRLSLHEQSHGESFLSLIVDRFFGNGLYLLDEPESALSPSRQLTLLRAIHELVEDGSQFVIATQSPILMGYPDSTIYWFSDAGIAPIRYTETEHYKITKSFLSRRETMLKELFTKEDDS
jgi:predicted ATPase